MDITQQNFKQVLPYLIQDIQNCEVISIDCEFGGISTHHTHKATDFDSLEDLYQKMKHTCINYSLLQVGICTLTWDKDNKKYVAKCYNIYLNQNWKKEKKNLHTQFFQTECYQFLAKNNLDFQKIYGDGVHFSQLSCKEKLENEWQKEKQKNHMRSAYGDLASKQQIFFSQDNQQIIKNIIQQIENFLKDESKKETQLSLETPFLFSKLSNGIILTEMGQFDNIAFEKSKNPNSVTIKKTKAKPSQLQEDDYRLNYMSEKFDIIEEIGVSLIIEEIIKSQKIVIGHHFSLDLLFIFQNFIEDLPNTYLEFTQKVNEYFPNIYDVKVLAMKTKQTLKKLAVFVEGLYKHVVESEKILKPFHNSILLESKEFQKYKNTEKTFHEAGFDAYATGVSFIALVYYNNFHKQLKLQEQKFLDNLEQNFQNQLQEYEQKKQAQKEGEYKKIKKPIKQSLPKNKPIVSQEQQQSLIKSILQNKIDTNNTQYQIKNHIFTRKGQVDMNHETLKENPDNLFNEPEFLENTIQIQILNTGEYNIQELGEFFSLYGDSEINICNNSVGYIQYFNFLKGMDLQSIVEQIKQENNNKQKFQHKYEFQPYRNRKQFKAFNMKQ